MTKAHTYKVTGTRFFIDGKRHVIKTALSIFHAFVGTFTLLVSFYAMSQKDWTFSGLTMSIAIYAYSHSMMVRK